MSVPAESLTLLTLDALLDRSDVDAIPVSGVCMDSRRIETGDVFFACAGLSSHGLAFAREAAAAGCAAIVFDPAGAPDMTGDIAVPMIAEPDLASRLGRIADRFFGSPSADIAVVGVTGTNGKTSVAWLLAECLQLDGRKAAYAGTLGYGLREVDAGDGMTTPDVFETHRRLAEMRDAGAEAMAIEVSSHALDQGRVDAVRFEAALFTNLSRDHLDYHPDMAAYEQAKARLFLDHEVQHRIINIDSEAGARIAANCGQPVFTVSMIPDADASLVIRSAEPTGEGFDIVFDSVSGQGEFKLPLLGAFNVENVAVVLGTLLAMGVEPAKAAQLLQSFDAPPGRLQIAADARPKVVVDYAHTPDALAAALSALRPNCRGSLWCVFGAGGDRDNGKRPLMAEAAEAGADRIIITSDNPRSETPSDIIADIVSGLARPESAVLIEDRAAAIAWAIDAADDDDIVLLAGKGHESVQIVGEQRLPFSDVNVARHALGVTAAEASS